MDVKEKLVEICFSEYCEIAGDSPCGCDGCPYGKYGSENDECYEAYKKHKMEKLKKAGVTIQQWIPVTERVPELIPCNAGTAYSEAVNVCTDGRKVMVAVWDGIDWLCDMDYWEAWGETITHWTPVLLPLPEPPKGD